MKSVALSELLGRAFVTADRLAKIADSAGLCILEFRMSQGTCDGLLGYSADLLTERTGWPLVVHPGRGSGGLQVYGSPVAIDDDMPLGHVAAVVVPQDRAP